MLYCHSDFTATSYLAQYGWFVLFGVVALYFLWKSALEPILTNLRQKSQLAAHKKYGTYHQYNIVSSNE